ncbi:fimbrial protein [Pantoea sp. CS_6]|uniref:fimbrial protein n=1 Tax=Pantoea sp. CS_6 TaxID=3055795 RepID=UPI0035C10304
MKKKVMLTAVAGLLALAATDAQAYSCATTTPSSVLTPKPLAVPRNLPVGSPIGSELVSGVVQTYHCSNTPAPAITKQEFGVEAIGTYITTIDGRRVYSTNVPGIGYAVGATTLNVCPRKTGYVDGTASIDGSSNDKRLCTGLALFTTLNLTAQARIQFYKTAQSTGTGTVLGGRVGFFILRNNSTSWVQPGAGINIADFNVTNTGCTVTDTTIQVPMGAVQKRAFGGLGTWPGDANTRSFSIPLDCNVGTRVSVQIDGIVQNAAQGVLKLNGGEGSATGVGIQLLHSNVPLPIAIPLNLGPVPTEGAYNIPFQARYYQTGLNIEPGSANASATFTMTYQ